MLRTLYLLLGLAVLGAAGYADLRGYIAARPSTINNIPRSIRQNPGAYRSLYNGSPRLFGGK
ncbi:MAG: hypothetical protein QM736_04090 [Vicinamibacterales bacterium]